MAKSIFKAMGTDKGKEKDGIWVDYVDGEDTFSFRLARAGGANDAFSKKLEQLTRPYRRANIDLDAIPTAKADEIWRQVYADTVILEWKGVGGEDGEPLEFTRENILRVLTELPDLFRFLSREANNFQNWRIASREAEAGN